MNHKRATELCEQIDNNDKHPWLACLSDDGKTIEVSDLNFDNKYRRIYPAPTKALWVKHMVPIITQLRMLGYEIEYYGETSP